MLRVHTDVFMKVLLVLYQLGNYYGRYTHLYLVVVFHTWLPAREAFMLSLASYALRDGDGPTSESP